ncbi:uncharacterized protein LOC101847433 [Aplysia californica]|uniref:Uncharacterized protein LOC101847433 n=1 Tax=Aplysia californica TaxID=6500 RepID=A0ABM1VV90_APLCA|nr:uncharacterized protein LOC101847433 [Aplysia californica]
MPRTRRLTWKERFKSLVGDALQLTQQNRRASQDFTMGLLEKKTRRKSVMKSVLTKKIPKLSDLVKTSDEKPYYRFRRMARVVLMLIQVCNVCKDLMLTGVKKEPWFALLDNLVATTNIKQKRKGPRAFVTFVPNEKRELVQLTFDVTEYKRDHRTEFILTDEVRDILTLLPACRPPEHIPKIIRCMKGLFEEFNNYPLSVQKQICQTAFYDRYRHNRVIVKKGQNPDGIYFVLSGTLIEKHDLGRQPKEIRTGSLFGENDLICGSMRRHTVLTRTDTELLFLHRQDYRVIFNMSEDSNDPKNLDICKQHVVFQHFPMNRLVDNPGTWSVLKYKYGRLIAKDNNEVDWIYVIKSGEARVFKYLEPGNIDVQARRKKVQAMINSQSTFFKKKKILNFVEDRDYIKTSYSPRRYQPSSRSIMSAPAGASRDPGLAGLSNRRDVFTCIPGMRTSRLGRDSLVSAGTGQAATRRSESKRSSIASRKPDSESDDNVDDKSNRKDSMRLPKLQLSQCDDDETTTKNEAGAGEENHNEGKNEKQTGSTSVARRKSVMVCETVEDIGHLSSRDAGGGRVSRRGSAVVASGVEGRTKQPSHGASEVQHDEGRRSSGQTKGRARSGSFLKTPHSATARSLTSLKNSQSQVVQVGNHTLPAFVQVETLHPGQAFGLRACLDPEERGPSVSLVSGECEILQINKKFFMKHCDDAIYSLIRLKAKPFPSQEDLIDRLDVNMQWEEYKQQTLKDFLQRCRRFDR